MITIYTDGSSYNNGQEHNIGGFAVIAIKDNNIEKIYHETVYDTTNNRMELMGIIKGFEYATLFYPDETCLIYTDSMYCVNICNKWIYTWAQNHWKNSKDQLIENYDLVLMIYHYLKKDFFNAEVQYCQGHKNIFGNELADLIARPSTTKAEIDKFLEINRDKYDKLIF